MGRFTIAAKHHQTIAEIYEGDVADLERAMQHYEKSADFFRVSHFLSLCEKTFNQFHVNCFFFSIRVKKVTHRRINAC